MLKKQKRILKTIFLLFFLGISSTFIIHYFSSSLTTTWVDDKWFKHQESSTVDPWLKKRWQHVKILTTTLNNFKASKTILLWTTFFGSSDYLPKLSSVCPVPKCSITSNRDYLNKSDALIFHLRDLSLGDMPHYRNSKQVWILLHHEAPPNTPVILNQLNGIFNWTATYRFDSEIILTPRVKKLDVPKVASTKNYAKDKSKLIAWFVSNCETSGKRERFVKELQKNIPVDIYGSCGPLTCLPKMSDECFTKISSKYRFYLSFENSICKDYVTEKFFYALNADIVPIVFGGANYSFVAPPFSYIDALAFKSPKDLANYLFKVAKDEKLYNSYFEWKKTHEIRGDAHYSCEICKKLHDSTVRHKIYIDINNWWFGDAHCKSWPI